MRSLGPLYVLLLAFAASAAVPACGSVRIDESASDRPPAGVIRGTVLYEGPRPCTRRGHVVGNAVLILFDRKNPPPPVGIATSAVNLGVVSGDVLFANEPRSDALDCPADRGDATVVRAAAPFTVSPIGAGSYMVQAFFDRRGDFLPTFKTANLPNAGDVAGGVVDAADALANAADPSYRPKFLPVDVGLPEPLPAGAPPDAVPTFRLPPDGFVRDNVAVTLGLPLRFARPYFHPAGAERPPAAAAPTPQNAGASFDPAYAPVLTIPQDYELLAPPDPLLPDTVAAFQARFPSLRLEAGFTEAERAATTDPLLPFHFDVPSNGEAALFVFRDGTREIPEGQGIPLLWPLVALTKLVDDPGHTADPQALTVQGTRDSLRVTGAALQPLVVMQAITVAQDDLLETFLNPPGSRPSAETRADHVTVLVRPAVVCFDPRRVDDGGVLVTPHLRGKSANPDEQVPPDGKPLFDSAAVQRAQARLVRQIKRGCLPLGRFAINVIYPTGQAWTVPNEAGGCAPAEGRTELTSVPGTCTARSRPVLPSQGARGVVEIVPAVHAETCAGLAAVDPTLRADGVPRECVELPAP